MMLPTIGAQFPAGPPHEDHEATVVAVDARGIHSWDTPWDTPVLDVPSVTVLCSCGALWVEEFPEALVA